MAYGEWQNTSQYRIQNHPGSEGYVCTFTVPWVPGMASNFRDIRFSDQNDRKLFYYIESSTNFVSATVKVRLGTSSTVYLHYGNPTATSESNAEKVYLFSDFFSGTTISSTKWTGNNGSPTYSISNGVVSVTDLPTYTWNVDSTSTGVQLQANWTPVDSFVFEATLGGSTTTSALGGVSLAIVGSDNRNSASVGISDTNVGDAYFVMYPNFVETTIGQYGNLTSTVSNFKVRIIRSGSTVTLYKKASGDADWVLRNTGTTNDISKIAIVFSRFQTYSFPTNVTVSNVTVRPYIATEPTPVLVSAGNKSILPSRLVDELNKKVYDSSIKARDPDVYSDWRNKIEYKIQNYPGSDYVCKIVVSKKPSMRADCRDFRFSDGHGSKLFYWVESYDSTTAIVQVKLKTSPIVYLHYNNPTAISESNGNNVFDFFDDFTDLSKWGNQISYNGGTGTFTVSNGIATLKSTNSTGISYPSASVIPTTSGRVRYKVTYQSNCGYSYSQTRFQITDNTNPDPGTANGIFDVQYDVVTQLAANSTSSNYSKSLSLSTPEVRDFSYGVANANYYINDTQVKQLSNTAPDLTGKYFRLWAYDYGEIRYDWICVRKYAAVEPVAIYVTTHTKISTPARLITPLADNGIDYFLNFPRIVTQFGIEKTSGYNSSVIAHENIDAYSSWAYKSRFKVNNYPGSDYVFSFTLNWRIGMAKDFKDIRIYDGANAKLSYWIENYTESATAKVHIKLGSSDTIYVHYGNPFAKSESNGSDVFIFFDDFKNGTSKWSSFPMTIVTDGNDKVALENNIYSGSIETPNFLIYDYVYEFDFQWPTLSGNGPRLCCHLGTTIGIIECYADGGSSGGWHNCWLGDSSMTSINSAAYIPWATSTWYTGHLRNSATTQSFIVDGKFSLSGLRNRSSTPYTGKIVTYTWDNWENGTSIKIRNPRIRKYLATEPTVTFILTEKTSNHYLRALAATFETSLPNRLFLSTNDILYLSQPKDFGSDIQVQNSWQDLSDLIFFKYWNPVHDIILQKYFESINGINYHPAFGSNSDIFIKDLRSSFNDIAVQYFKQAFSDIDLIKEFTTTDDIDLNKSAASLNDIFLPKLFQNNNDLRVNIIQSALNDIFIRALIRNYLDIQVKKSFTAGNDLRLDRSLINNSRIEVGQLSNYFSDILADLAVLNQNDLIAFLNKGFSSDHDLKLAINRVDLIDILLAKSFSSTHGLALNLSRLIENLNDILVLKDPLASTNDIQAHFIVSSVNWNDIFLPEEYESLSDIRVDFPFSSTNNLNIILSRMTFDSENDIQVQTFFEDLSDLQLSILAESLNSIEVFLDKLYENSNDLSLSFSSESSNDIEIFLAQLFESLNDLQLQNSISPSNDVRLFTGRTSSADIRLTKLFESTGDLRSDKVQINFNDLLIKTGFFSNNDCQLDIDISSDNGINLSKDQTDFNDIFLKANFLHNSDIRLNTVFDYFSDLNLDADFTDTSTIHGLLTKIYQTVNDICVEKGLESSHDIIIIFSENLVAAVSLRYRTVVVFYKHESTVRGRVRTVDVD